MSLMCHGNSVLDKTAMDIGVLKVIFFFFLEMILFNEVIH